MDDNRTRIVRENLLAITDPDTTWPYSADFDALAEMRNRLSRAGRIGHPITYSNLVSGIEFSIPSVNNGQIYRIDVFEWSGLDRNIVGNCLGRLSCDSFLQHGFFISSLAVDVNEKRPSSVFFGWLEDLGAIDDQEEATREEFWIEDLRRIELWFKQGNRSI